MVDKNDSGLNKLVCVLAQLSEEERERLLAEEHEKYQRDLQSCIEGEFKRGYREDLKIGIKKSIVEIKIGGVIKLVDEAGVSLKIAMQDLELDEEYKEEVIRELRNRGIRYIE